MGWVFENTFGVDHPVLVSGGLGFPYHYPPPSLVQKGPREPKSSPDRANGKAFQKENPVAKHRALRQRGLAPPLILQLKAAPLCLELFPRFKAI